MFGSRHMQLTLLATLGMMSHHSALSASLSDLQGAWAPKADACGEMFRKKGRMVEFVRKGLSAPTSFIIDGQRARGPRASCQIRSVRARSDVLDLRLSCDTAVISDSYTISVRFLDQDTIHRFDLSFPDIESRFERCKF
jgi:hypothetical protein